MERKEIKVFDWLIFFMYYASCKSSTLYSHSYAKVCTATLIIKALRNRAYIAQLYEYLPANEKWRIHAVYGPCG